MSKKTGVFITFWAKPGKFDALLKEASSILDIVAVENGTLIYAFHKVTDQFDGISVYEIYENEESQNIHSQSEAMAQLKSRLAPLLAAPPERYDLAPIPGAKGLPF